MLGLTILPEAIHVGAHLERRRNFILLAITACI
jgi:hypothetical protein